MMDHAWEQLQADVLTPDLCTQCGTCVGLSNGLLEMRERKRDGIPLPIRTKKEGTLPAAAFEGCPARRCHYPSLNRFVFGEEPTNWLSGVVRKSFVGHASDENIRRAGASGGVLSQLLITLLETKAISGAVCVQMGKTVPWRAEPVIARTREDILRCTQSVYSVTPVNTILGALTKEEGPLAYIGLPDQVASIRKLQQIHHPSVRNIRYVFGPYMGTQMSFEAIRSFLRSHGVRSEQEVTKLRYRAGEWPGHLEIHLRDGRILRAEKFHYNYLIPFFITKSSLQLVDFTNELTDISVGDAWSPAFEKERGGHSVILARSTQGAELLQTMQKDGLLTLQEIPLSQALDMHGHMLDFKKRGSFIRQRWMKAQPDYGYAPMDLPASRIVVERCLRFFFGIGRTQSARFVLEHLPLSLIGPGFNVLRKSWKALSKPTKRRKLRETRFAVCSPP